MEELLQKLFEAKVLSEETKKELSEAFDTKLEEAVEAAKKDAAADVRTELTEQWVQERDALIEAIDTKVGEFLDEELSELKDDIDRFRDLEADYAEKLVEAKASMSNELKDDLAELVEKIDAFLEIRLEAEMEELKEDIETTKRNDFGRRVFEGIVEEYRRNFADDDSIEGTLRETEERLADTQKSLEESEHKLAKLERASKLSEVLSPLDGRSREVMEAILRNVSTSQLEDGYKTFITRVLREVNEETSEKENENKVLAEDTSKEGKKKELSESDGIIVKGDNEEVLKEEKNADKAKSKLTETTRIRLQKLAGLRA